MDPPHNYNDLLQAILNDNLPAVQASLVEKTTWTSDDYIEALLLAVKHNRIDIVTWLLEHTTVDQCDPRPLRTAAKAGHIEMVKILLHTPVNVCEVFNDYGCISNCASCLLDIIKHPTFDITQIEAMFCATLHNQAGAVELLVKEFDLIDDDIVRALKFAGEHKHQRIAELIATRPHLHEAALTKLIYYCMANGWVDLLTFNATTATPADRKADVNGRLIWAIRTGNHTDITDLMANLLFDPAYDGYEAVAVAAALSDVQLLAKLLSVSDKYDVAISCKFNTALQKCFADKQYEMLAVMQPYIRDWELFYWLSCAINTRDLRIAAAILNDPRQEYNYYLRNNILSWVCQVEDVQIADLVCRHADVTIDDFRFVPALVPDDIAQLLRQERKARKGRINRPILAAIVDLGLSTLVAANIYEFALAPRNPRYLAVFRNALRDALK